MSFSKLPAEVTLLIICELCSHCRAAYDYAGSEPPQELHDRYALWSLCRMSRALKQIAQNTLYHSVVLECTPAKVLSFLRTIVLYPSLRNAVSQFSLLHMTRAAGSANIYSWFVMARVKAITPSLEHCQVIYQNVNTSSCGPETPNACSDCCPELSSASRIPDEIMFSKIAQAPRMYLRRLTLHGQSFGHNAFSDQDIFYHGFYYFGTLHLRQCVLHAHEFVDIVDCAELESFIYETNSDAGCRGCAVMAGRLLGLEFSPSEIPDILLHQQRTLRNLHIDFRTRAWVPCVQPVMESIRHFDALRTVFLDLALIYSWVEVDPINEPKFWALLAPFDKNRLAKVLPPQIVCLQLVRCKQLPFVLFVHMLDGLRNAIEAGNFQRLKCIKCDVDFDDKWLDMKPFPCDPVLEEIIATSNTHQIPG